MDTANKSNSNVKEKKKSHTIKSSKKDQRKKPSELKKYISKPQKLRIVKVFENLQENSGLSVTQAMKDLGYSEESANTQSITRTKTWQELVNHYLPEDKVLKAHKYLLKAKKVNDKGVVIGQDNMAIAKGVEMAYKIQGKYNDNATINNNILVLPSELLSKYNIKGENDTNKNS